MNTGSTKEINNQELTMDWLETEPMTPEDLLPTLWQQLVDYSAMLETTIKTLQTVQNGQQTAINNLTSRVAALEARPATVSEEG